MSDLVWVELDRRNAGAVVRIFRSTMASYEAKGPTDLIDYAAAVKSIRHACFVRSDGFCELCATPITETSCHMHELKWRGKGGEISLSNSVMACAKCHKYEHRSREIKFSKKDLTIGNDSGNL